VGYVYTYIQMEYRVCLKSRRPEDGEGFTSMSKAQWLHKSLIWSQDRSTYIDVVVGRTDQKCRRETWTYFITAGWETKFFMTVVLPPSNLVLKYFNSPFLYLTHGAETYLKSRQLCSYSRTSQQFMEPVGSLPCSQEPSNGSYPEPDRSSPPLSILTL
jgi:hypothetical protein